MTVLFAIIFLVSIVAFAVSLARPEALSSLFGGRLQKGTMPWLFGLLIPVSLILINVSADQKNPQIVAPSPLIQDVNQVASQEQPSNAQVENVAEVVSEVSPLIEVKDEKTTEVIPFKSITKNDATLEKGKTKIIQEGVDGVKEFTYKITYTNGQETARELSSENITVNPVDKIIANGTKEIQPVYVAPATCGADYYMNVDGNCVHRPSNNPSGASAKCRDGSYSYSAHRQGTCSGHGGVAQWL